MHENSLLLFRKYGARPFCSQPRVLEIGPTLPSSYQRIVNERVNERVASWDTIDIRERPGLTYVAEDEYRFAIADESYDVVLSGQVLEHVRKIWIWIKEVARVAKRGGLVITINPVSWPYHEAPYDCWRAYPEGMRALYDEANPEVRESRFESLELEGYPHTVPGRSPWQVAASQGWKFHLINRVLRGLGYPMERAYDTITIGRRR